MASITNTNEELQLTLTRAEKVAAMHGDIRVPASSVRDVRVEPDALAAVRGLRAPGLNLPWSKKIGTWRWKGRRQFAVARRDVPAVRVYLDGQKFDELIVSLPDAERVADRLRPRAGLR